MEQLLGKKELATILGVSTKTIECWVYEEKFISNRAAGDNK